MNYSDSELVKLLNKGDVRAFTEIHDRYYGPLYAHAYKRLSNREEVRDLLQDLFVFLWDNRESLHFTGHLSGYLYTAVRNRILNLYKRNKVRSDYIDSLQDFLDNSQPIADEILYEKELTAKIEKEIAALPQQMQIIFLLSRNQHLSHKEIGEKLGISPLTVKKQINNSLKILRSKLGSAFFIFFI